MTQERYETIKADFVNQYRNLLCEESMVDIRAAHDWHSFVSVLRKYMAFNTYRPFPDVEWVRKWFAEDKEPLHDESIYLDEMVVETAEPDSRILCYGACTGTVIYKCPGKHHVLLQDQSKLDILAFGNAVVFVKLKGEASAFVLSRNKSAIVKTRRYETKDDVKWR